MKMDNDDYVVYHGRRQTVKHLKYRQLCTQLAYTYNAMVGAYNYVLGMVCNRKRELSRLITDGEDCKLAYNQYKTYRDRAKMFASALREVKRDMRKATVQISSREYSMEFLKKIKRKKYGSGFRLQG